MDVRNPQLFPPRLFPFKKNLILGVAFCAYAYYYREKSRFEYMASLREKNLRKRDLSQQITQNFSANIKDFRGNLIEVNDPNYEYKMIYYGDFQTFFHLYAAEADILDEYKIKNIYLTDSTRTKDIMDNIMKVKLDNTWYAYEEDKEVIKESGLLKDHMYYLNQKNEVIGAVQVTPQDPMAAKNAIKSAQLKIRKDIDKKFLEGFDFKTLGAKNAENEEK